MKKIWLIIIPIVIIILLYFLFPWKEDYKVVNRSKKIVEAKQKNNEYGYTIGWLKIYDSYIDLPVINITPTEKGFDDAYVNLESYAWNMGKTKKFTNRITILGHNILNLSNQPIVGDKDYKRFEDLVNYVYLDFASDHEYIQYTIDDETKVYKVYAVYFTGDLDEMFYSSSDVSRKVRGDLETTQLKNSIYDFNVDVNDNDNILMLNTCTRFFGVHSYSNNLVVAAREVRKGEKFNKYRVIENKNYKEVKNRMKGSEDKNDA
jgi:hypothetical protein